MHRRTLLGVTAALAGCGGAPTGGDPPDGTTAEGPSETPRGTADGVAEAWRVPLGGPLATNLAVAGGFGRTLRPWLADG